MFKRIARKEALWGLAAGVGLVVSPAGAVPLAFHATPASQAAAQIANQYRANVIVEPSLNRSQPVSFSIPNAGDPTARLDAVKHLAHSLGTTYSKVYVISRADTEAAVSTPAVDTNTDVVFGQRNMPAVDAIQAIATADNAKVKYYGSIGGRVDLSASRLPAAQAADEVARQTHTRWKVFYAIGPTRDDTTANGGTTTTIIGYTPAGAPITESTTPGSNRYAHRTPSPSSSDNSTAIVAPSNALPAPPAAPYISGPPPVESLWNSPYGYNPYGYYPFGFYPYPYPYIIPSGPFLGAGTGISMFPGTGFTPAPGSTGVTIPPGQTMGPGGPIMIPLR